ncbi:hypothetical protein CC79DRAFT_1316383 [Sarocladium strictum]
MEARLLAELQHKLGLLDRKLRDHRLALLTEFDDYYRQRLHEQDPSLVSTISASLRSSLSDYPDLRPQIPLLDSGLSRELPTSTPSAAAFQASSPAAATAPEPRTLSAIRDHETDFQGLFTPSYLPLLDSRPPIPASPRIYSHPAPQAVAHPAQPGPGGAVKTNNHPQQLQPATSSISSEKAASMAAQDEKDGASHTPDPSLTKRPSHVRTSTDETTSSVMSDRSDKTRRSALRRSSSASKTPQSPRRVRFEYMGTEVLPTASPQASDMMTPRATSPRPGSNSESVLSDDDDDYEPPPRKISSSDALRALSRQPLEGTVWTVVNPESDDASSDHTNSRPVTPNSPATAQSMASQPAPRSPSVPIPEANSIVQRLGSVHEEQEDDESHINDDANEDDDNSSSDEEFLAMAKPKSFQNKSAVQPTGPLSPLKAKSDEASFSGPASGKAGVSREQKKTARDKLEDHAEEDDPFHFEMSGLSAPPRPRARPPPITTREDHDGDDDIATPAKVSLSAYSTSPAVSIARQGAAPGPPTPTSAKFQVGSVGSYKGRSIIMPVVRNPELHAQAESLGDFNTFVGGLDGGSGMDEGDMNSFRASVMQGGFSGTPRSLTERFMMEEAHAERKRRGEAP